MQPKFEKKLVMTYLALCFILLLFDLKKPKKNNPK